MALEFLKEIVRSQYLTTLPVPTASCEGQTILVTGSNIGLGFEAVKHFTRLNASKVIIACRSLEKGEAAKKIIEEETNRKGILEVWPLDLASYTSIKEFAARTNQLERIDVLLENAGISTQQFILAEENESTITFNVVSTFLLALLMLPKLKETASKFSQKPRLVIVSSGIHSLSNLPERNDPSGRIFDTLNDKEKAQMSARYSLSKLLEVFAVRELVERYAKADYPVIVSCFPYQDKTKVAVTKIKL
jgi:retinol dehydrogenase-12